MQNCNCNNCISGATIGKCGWFCRLTKNKFFKLALIVAFPFAGTIYSVVDAVNEASNNTNGGGGGSTPPDELANAGRMQQIKNFNKRQIDFPNTF